MAVLRLRGSFNYTVYILANWFLGVNIQKGLGLSNPGVSNSIWLVAIAGIGIL